MATTTRVSAGGLAKPSALRPAETLSFALVFAACTAIISPTYLLELKRAIHQAHPTFQSDNQGAMSAQGQMPDQAYQLHLHPVRRFWQTSQHQQRHDRSHKT